jgi:hypothetical protein
VKPGQGLDENGNPITADNAISDWDRSKSAKVASIEDDLNNNNKPMSATSRAGTAAIDRNSPTTAKSAAKVIDDKEEGIIDDELNEDEETEERVTVPLTITMIIITLYILLGAVIFNLFEGWTLIQSGYFCYITLATIGIYI